MSTSRLGKLTMSISEIGPILLTCILMSTIKGLSGIENNINGSGTHTACDQDKRFDQKCYEYEGTFTLVRIIKGFFNTIKIIVSKEFFYLLVTIFFP